MSFVQPDLCGLVRMRPNSAVGRRDLNRALRLTWSPSLVWTLGAFRDRRKSEGVAVPGFILTGTPDLIFHVCVVGGFPARSDMPNAGSHSLHFRNDFSVAIY